MIQTSAEVKNLFKAFHDAQQRMGSVVKDAKNPFFKSNYATLESVIAVAKPALSDQGLAFSQAPGELTDGSITVSTLIMHVSGEWMRSDFQMPLAKKDPQGTGAAISYACRYALMAVCGLPATDDDAESATVRENKKQAIKEPENKDAKEEFFKQVQDTIDTAINGLTLIAWWNSEDQKKARQDFDLSKTESDYYKNLVLKKNEELKKIS